MSRQISHFGAHPKHAELRQAFAEGGHVIADECATCGVRVAEYDTCDHCKKERARLTRFKGVRGGWKRFCDDGCHDCWVEAQKAAKKAARAAVPAPAGERASGWRK